MIAAHQSIRHIPRGIRSLGNSPADLFSTTVQGNIPIVEGHTQIDDFIEMKVPPSLHFEDTFLEIDQPPLKKQKLSPSSKKVRFADKEEIIDLGYQWSPEEIETSWYQPEETARIKHHNRLCIFAFHEVGCKVSNLPPKYCIRGLEQLLTRHKLMMIRYVRTETIHAILLAQHQDGGPHSACDRLRALSEMKSREKVRDAIKMASKDSRIWNEEYQNLV